MLTCITVKNENIEKIKIKNISEENIYKKCNYKNNDDFEKIKEWPNNNNYIELWGKKNGRKGSENTNELLTNNIIDKTTILYGKSIFLMRDQEKKFISLQLDELNNFFSDLKLNESSINNSEVNNIHNIVEKDKEIEDKEAENIEIDDNESEYSYNSELTYELYSYSDEYESAVE